MSTTLRAFLMLRSASGEWSVSVHRDLEGLLTVWNRRSEPENTVGVIHVGFDRPPSREFESVASNFTGRALVTGAAKFSLPPGFHASCREIGWVGTLPIFLATRGWGYIDDDDTSIAPPDPVHPHRSAEGWVRDFLALSPDAGALFHAANIFNDADYIDREKVLPRAIRHEAGLYRFERMIGENRNDPCAFARAAPPWLSERLFASMSLTVRVANVFAEMGLATVADLAELSLHKLIRFRNFGRKSVEDLNACLEEALREAPSVESKIDDARSVSLLASIERSLLKYSERERDTLRRRMGLDAPTETLQQIGDTYGISRERVRQIEAKAVKRLIREEFWDDLLSEKLKALLQSRDFPLPALGVEAADPWFTGIAQFTEVLRYILANMCEGRARLVTIDGVDYLTFLSQERWEGALNEARRLLESAVGKHWSEDHCRSLVDALLPETSREFRSLLWSKASQLCHFAEDGRSAKVLTSYGRGAERVVEAVLKAADRPLHFSEIAVLASVRANRDIDVRRAHSAAAAVGLLLGRGTYGVERHLPLDRGALEALGEEAEEVVSDGPSGRQWHASEILAALVERGADHALLADKYVVDIALQRSNGLDRLGRMIWTEHVVAGKEDVSRIDMRQAVIALLQQARRPLTGNEIRQRLVAIRGVNEYFQINAMDPLIRVGTALWGLNDRDVALKRPDQPKLLDDLVNTLHERGFAIHASELPRLGVTSIFNLSPATIFSLAGADARMRVNSARHLYLAEWDGPRRESVNEAVEAVLLFANRPLTFDEIADRVEARIRRTCERTAISACLRAIEAHLDLRSGQWSRRTRSDALSDDDLMPAE